MASQTETASTKRHMDSSDSTDSLDSTSIHNPKRNTKISKLTTGSVDKLFKLSLKDLSGRIPTSKVFVPNLFFGQYPTTWFW